MGIPDYQSNILAEYRIPRLTGLYFNFDWQHVGRRPMTTLTALWPQYNNFDVGLRYATKIYRKSDQLAGQGQQRHGCALLVHDEPGQSGGNEHRQLSWTPGRAAPGLGVRALRLLSKAGDGH